MHKFLEGYIDRFSKEKEIVIFIYREKETDLFTFQEE